MIIKTELVKRIKDHFGLNIYETKVWLALLSKGVVSAGETAELSGVPRSRTYDVLESLAKRGFAIVKIGKPVKYIAVEPKTVVDKMKNQTMSDAQEKVNRLATLKETPEYSELENIHKTNFSPVKLEDMSGHVKGRANVMAKIRELCDNSKKEVVICTSLSDFEKKARVLSPALEKLASKDVKVKLALSGDVDRIKRLSSKGNVRAKLTDNKGRFFIVDKEETLFMLQPEGAEDETGIWLRSPYFASMLSNMFEAHLKQL